MAYTALRDRMQKRLDFLRASPPNDPEALLASLNAFLLESAWAVPSDTQSEPDVSLYDHLRLTAAFAAALWRYHEEIDGEVNIERLRQDDEEKFLLISGDLGGIQKHIYRVSSATSGVGGIAKRLRARSLSVALAAESMARETLEATGLSFLNRVLSAGGKFTLLTQNTPSAIKALQSLREDWQAWALDHGATLTPFISWVSFSPADLKKGSFGKQLERLAETGIREKLRPFAHAQKATPAFVYQGYSPHPCPVCGTQPSQGQNPDGSWQPCVACSAEQEIGGVLPKMSSSKSVIGLHASEPEKPYFAFPHTFAKVQMQGDFTYRTMLDFAPGKRPFEVRPLSGRVPSVDNAERVSKKSHSEWLVDKKLNRILDELGTYPERPLTFEEIAHFSDGAPHLGVLMLDADRMGEIFARGLLHSSGRDLRTPSRIASLSRMLEFFFGFVATRLVESPSNFSNLLPKRTAADKARERYPLIYGVYAGGDDVF